MANLPQTELDKKLLEIANNNWPQFVALVGEDCIIAAKTCMLRQQKKSYGQIMVALNYKAKSSAQTACNRCPESISL